MGSFTSDGMGPAMVAACGKAEALAGMGLPVCNMPLSLIFLGNCIPFCSRVTCLLTYR